MDRRLSAGSWALGLWAVGDCCVVGINFAGLGCFAMQKLVDGVDRRRVLATSSLKNVAADQSSLVPGCDGFILSVVFLIFLLVFSG
jgi:hypothetical protein